jgi:peptide/nickel transport system substrate-binding protein
MTSKKSVFALTVAALLTVGTCAVAGATPKGTAHTASLSSHITKGGTLTFDRDADIFSLDPTQVSDNESIWALENIFETMYEATPNGKALVPWLATGYTLSKNHLSWTFTLRKGVKFSNGKVMTSADVKFSIERVGAKASNPFAFINAAIKNITTPTPDTVTITTKTPWAPMQADMALFANGVIPNNYAGETPAVFWKHPIGTGPFMVKNWAQGSELSLVKNPYYWQPGKPYLDALNFVSVPDDNTRQLQLESGAAQVDEFPPFSTISSLQSTANVKVGIYNSSWTQFLGFNETFKYFKDVHVRRAISYAIDRKALISAVLYGHGTVANSQVTPALWDYDPKSPGIQYNLSMAKAQMKASAYPKGFSVKLLVGSGNTNENSLGQIVQAELKPLGIKVTLQEVSGASENTMQQDSEFQMSFLYDTTDIIDPDELITFAAVGGPAGSGQGTHAEFTNYYNPALNKLATQAEGIFSQSARQVIYNKIQVILDEDAPMAYLYYQPFVYAYGSNVHGFTVYPTGNYHFENVWLSK